ncbi:purine-nucleoside phosphorylase [Patescibacteria group bacterium]|nr:purine-nucleoside phosphorylase [Patescibacteria group bacterium]MBU1705830.1 purine-nucleoside phosphorylase [Patescibacteria group bacterium]
MVNRKKKPVKAEKFKRSRAREEAAKIAAQAIKEKLNIEQVPKVALVLGTGWGNALKLKESKSVSFKELPGFEGLGDLEGHQRKVVYGFIDEAPVIALSGRVHVNEGIFDRNLINMVRLQVEMLLQLGVHKLILTCAAGGIPTPGSRPSEVGDIVAIDGFLTVLGNMTPPLEGGEFYSADDVISDELLELAEKNGDQFGLKVKIGGYCYYRGPNFEGRKYDKRFIALSGVMAVGMSTLPEALVCALYRDEGVEILPIAFITNSSIEEHSHEENMARAKEKSKNLGNFVSHLATLVSAM